MNDKNTELNQKLANLALQQYDVIPFKITRLGGVQNINFRVEEENGNAYLLRLHIPSMRQLNEIQVELAWLQDISSATSLIVPRAIANLNGEQITQLHLEDTFISCTLMTWIEGKIPPTIEALDDLQLEQVGEAMAGLHLHSQSFSAPKNFSVKTIDIAYFEERFERLYTTLEEADFAQNSLEKLQKGIRGILNFLANLKRTSANFGLIHADFHSGNYLIHKDKVRIIDFGSCGLGFYLFDLALALMELTGEERVAAFLKGYEKILPLSEENSKLVDLFLCLAYVDNLGFWAANPDELPYILGEMPRLMDVLVFY